MIKQSLYRNSFIPRSTFLFVEPSIDYFFNVVSKIARHNWVHPGRKYFPGSVTDNRCSLAVRLIYWLDSEIHCIVLSAASGSRRGNSINYCARS